MTCSDAIRCSICKSSSMSQGAERGSRPPHWPRLGSAAHRVLSCSPCVSEREGAQRLFGPEPLAFAWTSAPALEIWRALLPVKVGCPSPEPGPHWHTHCVEPPLCLGRSEGTDTFLGRRKSHPCFSALAIAMVTEPPYVFGADTGCLACAQKSRQNTLPEDDDVRPNTAEKSWKIRS